MFSPLRHPCTLVFCVQMPKKFKFWRDDLDIFACENSGLSTEAGSRPKSAGCQTTLRRLVLPGHQLKRNTLCLKSLKRCPRLQEIASKQLFFSKNFRGRMAPDSPSLGVQSAPKPARCAHYLEYQPPTLLQSDSYSKLQ